MDELSPISFQNALVNTDNGNSNIRDGCACKASGQQMLRANNNNNGGFTSSWNQMNDMLKQPVGEGGSILAISLLEITCGVTCTNLKNMVPNECKDVFTDIAKKFEEFKLNDIAGMAEKLKKCITEAAPSSDERVMKR